MRRPINVACPTEAWSLNRLDNELEVLFNARQASKG
jgi:hypothetical protein